MLWLAASGLLLNHTDALDLDERYVQAGWLLDWYGVGAPREIVGYRVAGHWISRVDERIYFDGRPLAGEYATLRGAVALNDEIALATRDRVLLLTDQGQLAEALGTAHGVPAGIRAIGLDRGRLVVRSSEALLVAAPGLVAWRALAPAQVAWSRAAEVPEQLRAQLVADYRARMLSFERVLLDLHSGRALGWAGVLVMDLAALAFLGLALTGFWLWARRFLTR